MIAKALDTGIYTGAWVLSSQTVDASGRPSGPEKVGSVRECDVNFAGRKGQIVERCAELVPSDRIGYVVDDDSLGFNRMFADYGFTITLEDAGPLRTSA